MPGNIQNTMGGPLVRNMLAATRAAVKHNPQTACTVRLIDGSSYHFRIEEVLDDALLGTVGVAKATVCLIPMSAVAMIEFL